MKSLSSHKSATFLLWKSRSVTIRSNQKYLTHVVKPKTKRFIANTIIYAKRRGDENQIIEERRALAKQRTEDNIIVYTSAIALTSAVAIATKFGGDFMDSADAWIGNSSVLTLGDTAGGILWSISYYFVSPIQLLLLFLGRIETERPSDFLLNFLGKLLHLDIDAIDYKAPLSLVLVTVLLCTAGGFLTSYSFETLLGDATWAVSTGIGACFAAAIYEVGRPERLSSDEAITLENQWQDFVAFADEKLERSLSARCHETEVFQAFRRQYGRYRDSAVVSDARLRDMVKNWHPAVARSRTGWYKGLSLKKYDANDSNNESVESRGVVEQTMLMYSVALHM